jgi:ectoine hydroxylase
VIVRSFDELTDTDRHVKTPNWQSKRIVLAKEGVGFSLHETVLDPDTVNDFWYANHIEAVVCVEGEGELLNKETGETYQITRGTMYLLDKHEHHQLRPITRMRTICVFNPPVTGQEVHDENGVYPLVVEGTLDGATTSGSSGEVTYTPTPDLYPTRTSSRPRLIERAHPTVWLGRTGPISPDDLASHARKGFHIISGLLDGEEVQSYREELGRLSTDPKVKTDERTVGEKTSQEIRSIFEVHKISDRIGELVTDPRVLGRAEQILGSEVYVHQCRINYMPGFTGAGFYWHSDFETWHAEDGMPAPRAVSISIALTDNYPFNGGLMVMPGSQQIYACCVGQTPDDNYKESLREQDIGTPDHDTLRAMAHKYGIEQFTGPAGSALMFDCNVMHGSNNNITPFPRSNIFIVFNSVDNKLAAPYAAPAPRPTFVANRDFTPVG